MSLSSPVRYSPDVETLEPDEAETITDLNETFDTILETTAKDGGHAVRSVYAKAHAAQAFGEDRGYHTAIFSRLCRMRGPILTDRAFAFLRDESRITDNDASISDSQQG